MLYHNCVVKIEELSGASNNKAFTSLTARTKALIQQASNDLLILYPEIPISASYSLTVVDNSITRIKPGSKVTILYADTSGHSVNDVFITQGEMRKTRILGNIIFNGLIVKQNT